MYLAQYLGLGAVLFSLGVYGVLARKSGVMILMAVELMLAAVTVNLVALGAYYGTATGQVFSLFVIAVAAAEIAVGLAIVMLLSRNANQ